MTQTPASHPSNKNGLNCGKNPAFNENSTHTARAASPRSPGYPGPPATPTSPVGRRQSISNIHVPATRTALERTPEPSGLSPKNDDTSAHGDDLSDDVRTGRALSPCDSPRCNECSELRGSPIYTSYERFISENSTRRSPTCQSLNAGVVQDVSPKCACFVSEVIVVLGTSSRRFT